MVNLIEAVKFGVGYFLLMTLWFTILPSFMSTSLIETFIVSAGYVLAAYYLVISGRSLSISQFVVVIASFFLAKMITPLFLHQQVVYNFVGGQTVASIMETAFYLFLLIGGMIWASRVVDEEQEITAEQVIEEIGW